jgi:hypothetical protein
VLLTDLEFDITEGQLYSNFMRFFFLWIMILYPWLLSLWFSGVIFLDIKYNRHMFQTFYCRKTFRLRIWHICDFNSILSAISIFLILHLVSLVIWCINPKQGKKSLIVTLICHVYNLVFVCFAWLIIYTLVTFFSSVV